MSFQATAEMNNDQILEGMAVLTSFREHGIQALSEFSVCFPWLIRALGWQGRPNHVAEALPHFIDNLDLDSFRVALANLNYKTVPVRVRQDRIDPELLPCLFVPDKGAVLAVLAETDGGHQVYDGFTRSTRTAAGKRLWGMAYIVRPDDRRRRKDQSADGQSWMAGIAARFRRLMVQIVIVTFMFNLLSLGMPLFMLSIYDTVIPSGSVYQFYYLLIGVMLALGLETIFRRIRSRALAFLAGRIDYLVGTAAFQKVLFLPVSMSENEALGAQISHLQEFESIREFFTGPLGETLLDLPFVFLFLAVIAALSGWLVLVPVVAAIVFILCGFATAPLVKRSTARAGRNKTIVQRFLVEAVSGMRSIKLAGVEANWMERYRDISAGAATSDFRVSMANHTVQTVSRVIMLAAGIAMVGFGAGRVMDGELTIGALVACMALVWRCLGPLQTGFVTFNKAAQIRSSLRQMNHLMGLKTEREPGEVPARWTVRGKISFIGVSHRFRTDADPALNAVSFDVEPGEMVAITGPNGAGKSTIGSLAAGLYRPQYGSVLIDGRDVRQIDPIDLRQQISIVPQNSQLFYGTVAQNLRLAVPTAVNSELVRVTRQARVYDDIMGLPEGFDTRLSETMLSKLSEGFRQKLCIARAYLRAGPIMIFDEPEQMLDENADNAFMAAMQSLRGNATIMFITHRPSYMRMADRLLVMGGGRIELNGPPDAVLKQLAERAS